MMVYQMGYEEAREIVGNQPDYALRNMVKALKIMRALNTEEEERRLEAAQVVLRNRKRIDRYC